MELSTRWAVNVESEDRRKMKKAGLQSIAGIQFDAPQGGKLSAATRTVCGMFPANGVNTLKAGDNGLLDARAGSVMKDRQRNKVLSVLHDVR